MHDHGSVKEAERSVSNKRGKYARYSAVQSTKLGSMPPSAAQEARYENTKGKFLRLTRVQYVRYGRNTKRNSRKNENRRLNSYHKTWKIIHARKN